MKYILIFMLSFVVFGCAVLGGSRDDTGSVHEYEGTAQGYRGPIQVQVRMSGGSITDIVIIDSEEDSFVGGAAMEELIDTVILYNTTDVDAVSGATESSRGFLEAVENAIMGL
ncbi:MAG: FMN-binding protein [Treponema sp.]|jgi:uncharacterized protein with FMN-binding domain|nr:FMN-binding protein [Treponema sp.]